MGKIPESLEAAFREAFAREIEDYAGLPADRHAAAIGAMRTAWYGGAIAYAVIWSKHNPGQARSKRLDAEIGRYLNPETLQ